ncbi:MAG: 23S rRNA pseudouridine(2604) synthase RluF [Lachnospiraceae bacterium]|nr:23S rRNA pseudouridine(2604) synthase RluF [Agathobacter sp.]MDD6446091.1 23S rRNA pseudouridine(2604) synthase RluF [Lachnospiraceae bacterium]MDY4892553.1 23S rRNA pseudouridine(2604) synthase RluF [Agathobacter sp.]
MEVRINKFLSEAGVCSRREADRQIEAGNVTIDGRTAQMGDKVMEEQVVCFQGKPVKKEEEMILIAFHKPAGIVCTAEKREKNNVIDYLNYPKRIYPVGRLDKDSEGLLLLTNNGDMVNKIMRAGNMHEKEYIVTVNKPVTDSFLRGLAGGVPLVELGVTTRKCRVERIGKKQFRIILTQGLNRQIRRMCEYFGYRVQKLVRVRIMNIRLGDLECGKYRDVTPEEYRKLLELTADSSNAPMKERRHGYRKTTN